MNEKKDILPKARMATTEIKMKVANGKEQHIAMKVKGQ